MPNADTPTEPALVTCEDLRVDVDGVPACDGLSFTTKGERVLVLGAPRALFDAAVGLAPIVRGRLAIRGVAADEAARRGVIAGAALDPPTPPRWSVSEYVEWSARLAGHAAREARVLSSEAVARLELGAMRDTPLGRLAVPARRATVIAAAAATGAEVLALEDPLSGLPDEAARPFARALVAALDGRPCVVFAARVPLSSPLALHADEAVVASATRVDAQGAPAEIAAAERRFVARLEGPVDELAALATPRGASVTADGAKVLVDLGADLSTHELFDMCEKLGVTVVELVPVARALS